MILIQYMNCFLCGTLPFHLASYCNNHVIIHFKKFCRLFYIHLGFPGGSNGEESASNAGGLGAIPGLGRSAGEGNGNQLQYSRLENSHGQRSLAGYSPGGLKESDRAERLTLSLYPHSHYFISFFYWGGESILQTSVQTTIWQTWDLNRGTLLEEPGEPWQLILPLCARILKGKKWGQ